MRIGWSNRLTTLREGVLGECYVLLIHQLDNRTVWRVGSMKRLLLFDLHFGTLHLPFTHAFWHFLWKRFLRLLTSPKAHLTCWISQILNTHLTCIEYLWSVESENHIGPKKSIAALNRLFMPLNYSLWEIIQSLPCNGSSCKQHQARYSDVKMFECASFLCPICTHLTH